MTAPAPPGSDQHTCHAKTCTTEVPPAVFMCRLHWGLVPAPMREAITALYQPGQEVNKRPSDEYLAIAKAAIDAVAHKEARRAHAAAPIAAAAPPAPVSAPAPAPAAGKSRKPRKKASPGPKPEQLALF